MIPISAVDHIEVLKDSAAAQYGSDAVAGVINIILKRSASGGHAEASYGQLFSGQGETIKTAADHGLELGDGASCTCLQMPANAVPPHGSASHRTASARFRG